MTKIFIQRKWNAAIVIGRKLKLNSGEKKTKNFNRKHLFQYTVYGCNMELKWEEAQRVATRIWFYARHRMKMEGTESSAGPFSPETWRQCIVWYVFFRSSFLPSWPAAHALTKREQWNSSSYLFIWCSKAAQRRKEQHTAHHSTNTAESNWVESSQAKLPASSVIAIDSSCFVCVRVCIYI